MKPDEQENPERGMTASPKPTSHREESRRRSSSAPPFPEAENSGRAEHAGGLAGNRKHIARRRILDDLARSEYAEGVYDRVPDDFGLER